MSISPEAQQYWAMYCKNKGATPLLVHAAAALIRAGITPVNLASYLELSGIDSKGAKGVLVRIKFYDKARLDDYHEGGSTSADLSLQDLEALSAVCNAFRDARQDTWAEDDERASQRIRNTLVGHFGDRARVALEEKDEDERGEEI